MVRFLDYAKFGNQLYQTWFHKPRQTIQEILSNRKHLFLPIFPIRRQSKISIIPITRVLGEFSGLMS